MVEEKLEVKERRRYKIFKDQEKKERRRNKQGWKERISNYTLKLVHKN